MATACDPSGPAGGGDQLPPLLPDEPDDGAAGRRTAGRGCLLLLLLGGCQRGGLLPGDLVEVALPVLDRLRQVALQAAQHLLAGGHGGLGVCLVLLGFGDEADGLLLVDLQLRLPHLDLVLGLLHLRQQLALGVRHPLHVLDAVQQIGERARPQHLEHVGAVALVGRDEERGQVLLGDPQVGLGQLQPAGVLADVRLHLRQLRCGPVVRLGGRVELLVERVQLVLDLGDLRPLLADPVRACRTGSGSCGKGGDNE